MTLVPEGTIDAAAETWQGAMDDTLTVWRVEEDTQTASQYDTTKTELYGPNTSPHDGKASVSADTTAFQQAESGDQSLEADAVVTLPLISASVEDDLLDKRCEATFRGQTRTGRVVETRRREVTVQVAVEWT